MIKLFIGIKIPSLLIIMFSIENVMCEIGICPIKESSQIPATVLETYQDYVTYSDMCKRMFFNRPCTKIKEIIRTRVKYTLKTKYTIRNKCCDGFVPTATVPLSDSQNVTHCTPICMPECGYARCVGPNVCKCLDGYVPSASEINHCVPHCDHCTNGICVHPQLCQCLAGFNWDTVQLNCLPKCSTGCTAPYGECVAPGSCQCNAGYKYNVLTGACEADCAKGYEWNSISNNCTPICEKGCKNGICIRPNECQCNENYQLDKFTTCKPTKLCSIDECGGQHEKCKFDVCECENGYQRNAKGNCIITTIEGTQTTVTTTVESDSIAKNNVSNISNQREYIERENCTNYPICLNEKSNGNATAICLCNRDFKRIKLNNNCYECTPRCKTMNMMTKSDDDLITNVENIIDDADADADECVNGECISPGICKCNVGYYFIDTDISNFECLEIGNCYNCTAEEALKFETNNKLLAAAAAAAGGGGPTTTDTNNTMIIVIGTVVSLTVLVIATILIVYKLRRNAILRSHLDQAEGCASMPIYYHEEPST